MKTLWEIFKGTLTGLDNQGSAKRATAAFITSVIILSMVAVYEVAFLLAVKKPLPTSLDSLIVDTYPNVIYSFQIMIYILLGLATVETITNLVRTLKGGKSEEPKQS